MVSLNVMKVESPIGYTRRVVKNYWNKKFVDKYNKVDVAALPFYLFLNINKGFEYSGRIEPSTHIDC